MWCFPCQTANTKCFTREMTRQDTHILPIPDSRAWPDLLWVEVVVGELQGVVIAKVPEDGPGGLVSAPLDEQRVQEQKPWRCVCGGGSFLQ